MKTLLLNKEDVGRLIRMKEVIETVEEAYKAFSWARITGRWTSSIEPDGGGRSCCQ